jgi:hypothetical protein
VTSWPNDDGLADEATEMETVGGSADAGDDRLSAAIGAQRAASTTAKVMRRRLRAKNMPHSFGFCHLSQAAMNQGTSVVSICRGCTNPMSPPKAALPLLPE